MSDFAFVDGPHLIGFQGHDGGGAAIECDEFHFISLAVTVNVDDRAHVPGFQPFSGHGRRQYDSIMFVYHLWFSFVLRVGRDQTGRAMSEIDDPHRSHRRCLADRSFDQTINNVLLAVRRCHVVVNFRRFPRSSTMKSGKKRPGDLGSQKPP